MYKEYLQKLENLKGKELKSERIELGLVDDIEKIYGEIINSASKADKSKNNAIDSIRQFKSQVVKIKQDSAVGLKKVEEFKKAAKELGVDIPSRVKGLEKQLETTLKAMKDWQSAAEQAMKSF